MRLIDADELKKALAEMWYEKDMRITVLSVADLIDEAPTIEPSKSTDQNLENVPSGDLISRADAIAYIDRVTNSGLGKYKSLDYISKYISALPSAERPTVIRSKTLMPTKDFKEWAKRIREVNPNAVVIPCDAEDVSADRPQVKYNSAEEQIAETCDKPKVNSAEWVAEKEKEFEELNRPKGEWIRVTNGRGGHECSNCHAYAPSYMSGDEYLSDFCPNCGARMKGGAE